MSAKDEFKGAKIQLEKEIREAVVFLRTKNQTIPSETIEFMKIAALEKLDECDGKNELDNNSKLNMQNVSKAEGVLVFTGIGYCGMSKDVEVKGKLTEVNKQHDHAIITDEKGMPQAVIYKTLKTCC